MLKLLGRSKPLFEADIEEVNPQLGKIIQDCRFLVIGAAGSIGQAVTMELFKRNPKKLHVVDISENNMVELVRSIRSSIGYGSGDFKTFALDCKSDEFKAMWAYEGPYDYVFNLSALKHVRSEKDPFTLMRLIQVNIFNTLSTLEMARKDSALNYFCVSTDKAANPVNMMGASKKIMEQFLMRESLIQQLSMARFANVAFSDGSLLHGFEQRMSKMQPLSAPSDVRRYFVTPQEAGEQCLLSGLLGENRDIFFPKLSEELHLETFSNIAVRFLETMGYEPFECDSETEARAEVQNLIHKKKWPVYFFKSDTTGEKPYEEFFTKSEEIDMNRFVTVGVIKNRPEFDGRALEVFSRRIEEMRISGKWQKNQIVDLFCETLPDFIHEETGKNLDGRM